MIGAGDLRDRYRFDDRAADANGDKLGDWIEGFSVAAQTTWLRGGESVVSSRLEGTQPVALTIRDSAQARTITPGFRAVNSRTGQPFNITAVSPAKQRGFIDVLCVAGTAEG